MTDQILDFGLMSLHDTKCTQMTIQNFNPFDIMLQKSSILEDLSVHPMSNFKIEPNPSSNIYKFNHKRIDSIGFPVKLLQNSTMFFEVCLGGGKYPGKVNSTLNFITDHQTLKIPVIGKFAKGELWVMGNPVQLPYAGVREALLDDVRIEYKDYRSPLLLRSTFKEIFLVKEVISEPPHDISVDVWSSCHDCPIEKRHEAIKPNYDAMVATIKYNASIACPETTFGCYGSLRYYQEGPPSYATKEAEEWHSDKMKAKLDAEYYLKFRKLHVAEIRRSLLLITSMRTTLEFEVQASIAWPQLMEVNNNEVRFPPTIVMDKSESAPIIGQKTITIKNPTRDWIQVQPILITDIRPHSNSLLDVLRDDYSNIIKDSKNRFSESFGVGPVHTVGIGTDQRKLPHRWILGPGQSAPLHLGFFPKAATDHESILILRNNLTVIEPLRLFGKGIEEKLSFPDENDQIIMTMTKTDLKDCHEQNKSKNWVPFKKGSINKGLVYKVYIIYYYRI